MDTVKEWWVSCQRFTCWVKTNGNVIIDAAPIAKKWKGQNFLKFIAYYTADKEELKYEKVFNINKNGVMRNNAC